ncbi:MAG: 1-acyl-sn-glycerol-3-phosphate acyltransferase [Eubacteriales bacterium]|nr:1-acyl-sn-glycerol-3-phosphate acyltransferase [Eubacteriales bacterium]
MEKERTGEKLRRFIHPLVLKAISATRNFRLDVSGTIPEGQPFLFVANHYCIDDVPTVGEVIGRHVYALVSDEDRGTLSGLALDVNGVVWTNRLDKEARRQSKEELVRHLRLGHSVLMYPEATWNLSPN